MVRQNEVLCPCESGEIYDKCCGPLLAGTSAAKSALALMRSRYTAYTEGNSDYLVCTWHPNHRPLSLEAIKDRKWVGLQIKRVEYRLSDDTCIVEFVARFKIGGKGHRLHEISHFVCEAGYWYYTTGEVVR